MSDKNQLATLTNAGKWVINEEENIIIDCYVTNNKRRLLSLRGTARAMGLTGGGSGALVRNLSAKWIQPYLSDDLREWYIDAKNKEIEMVYNPKGKDFIPFDGELFVDLCNAYINAQKDSVFETITPKGNQDEIADKLLKIMSAFAKVGIVALIDEITGYQDQRESDELQTLLAKYIRKEFLPWTKRFPEEFYIEMFRLRGWEYKGNKKPPLVGKLTNKLVYDTLPNPVLNELESKNPVVGKKSYRRYKHHQFLTEDTGVTHLDRHLASVITLMRACDTWDEFDNLFNKVFVNDGHLDNVN